MKKISYTLILIISTLIFVGCANNNLMIERFEYDKNGYDKNGYDKNGYDRYGCDKDGFNKYTKEFNCKKIINKYKNVIFDKEGFDKNGFNLSGYNKEGFDKNGYNKEGFDKNGFNLSGYNKEGFDKNGYNKEGFDKNGFNNLHQNKNELLNNKLIFLINSKTNINTIIESNLKKLEKKDKYESDEEYFNRIKNLNLIKSGIMEISITKEYDPNKKMYKVFFDTTKGIGSNLFIHKIKYGKESLNTNEIDYSKFNEFNLSYIYKSSNFKDIQSNAYGKEVVVTTYLSDKIIAFVTNLEKILKLENLYTYKKEYYQNDSYFIGIPMDKEKAKKLDKQNLKLKINLEFENIFDIYKGISGSKATITSPIAFYTNSYLFKAKVNEFVLFNESTNEILFSYIEL